MTTAAPTIDRLTPALIAAGAVAAVLPACLTGRHQVADMLAGGLVNPDSAMRLVRLHDILSAGQPLHAVMRDGSGDGTMLHWSHLLDSILLLLAAPLAAVLGWDRALHAVGVLFGPLCLGGLGVAVVWAALPLAGRGWAWAGALAAGVAPALYGYGLPGVVHHHILLVVGATMTAGWALRLLRGAAPGPDGIALGAWAGAGLWLSPESLPFALMALGALWAGWAVARGPDQARLAHALLAASTTFLLVATAAWLVDPPAPGYAAIEPDRLSLPFILLALGAALTASLAWATRRLTVTAGFGAAIAMLWLLAFPQMHRGTEGLMPPDQAAAFFDGIMEMLPVGGPADVLDNLLGGLFAVAVLATLVWRRPGLVRLYALACAVALVAFAAVHVRFAPYPTVAGAAVLPMVLASISRNAWAPARQSLARLALLLPMLLTPVLAPLAASATPGHAGKSCTIGGAITLLGPHPDEIVLSDVNLVPDLLYRTPVRTVGSLYHRNPTGFMRLRAAWRSIPGDAPSPELRATRAQLLLACPGGSRSSIVQDLPKQTLLDRVQQDDPPAWLHRLGASGGFVLYSVAQ